MNISQLITQSQTLKNATSLWEFMPLDVQLLTEVHWNGKFDVIEHCFRIEECVKLITALKAFPPNNSVHHISFDALDDFKVFKGIYFCLHEEGMFLLD